MTATVLPADATNKAVGWSSSNTSVATVDDKGVVTGVVPGTAKITVTTEDGGKTDVSEITVVIPVTGVSVVGPNLEVALLYRGETTTVSATVLPADATNKNVRWSSSNTDVAIVSSTGVVTNVNTGRTRITATTEDGGFTASVDIEVRVYATSLRINSARRVQAFWNRTIMFSASVDPSDALDGKVILWRSSNPGVVSIDQLSGVARTHQCRNCEVTITACTTGRICDSITVVTLY